MNDPVRYRFSPRDRTGLLLGLSTAQCIIIAAGLVAGGVVLPASPLASLAVALVAVAAAFATWQQQPAWRHATTRLTWTRSRNRRRWLSMAPFRHRRDGVELPPSFGPIRVWSTPSPGGAVAVVEDQRAHTFTVTVPVTARGFGLLDPADQDRRLAAWGEILAGFTSTRHPIAQLVVVEHAGPARGELFDPGTAADPGFGADYAELLAEAAPAASHHVATVTLTIRQPKPQKRWRVDPKDGVAAAVEHAQLLARRLDTAGLTPGPPLHTSALLTALSRRLDPTQPTAGTWAGPMAVRAEWDHVQVDGSAHQVLWVAEWPRLPVPATWLEPLLLHPGVTRTLTLLLEPVPPGQAAREVRRDATRLAADQTQRERGGWRIDAEQRRTQAELDQREAELAAGYGEINYLALLTVTAATPDQLRAVTPGLLDAAAQSGLEVRGLDGRHHDALPVAIGLLGRPVGRPRLQ